MQNFTWSTCSASSFSRDVPAKNRPTVTYSSLDRAARKLNRELARADRRNSFFGWLSLLFGKRA